MGEPQNDSRDSGVERRYRVEISVRLGKLRLGTVWWTTASSEAEAERKAVDAVEKRIEDEEPHVSTKPSGAEAVGDELRADGGQTADGVKQSEHGTTSTDL